MTEGESPEDIEKALAPRTPEAGRRFAKTPFFVANSALRYHRQQLIKDIETLSNRKLLCYVCGNEAEIHRDDTAGFVDMLHNVHAGDKIDLVLHTGGGDIDVAEKLIKLAGPCWRRWGHSGRRP